MKHYEICYYIGRHAFTFACTTAHEAYEAMADIAAHDASAHIDLDDIMQSLVSMKHGDQRSFTKAKFSIRYLDGEV